MLPQDIIEIEHAVIAKLFNGDVGKIVQNGGKPLPKAEEPKVEALKLFVPEQKEKKVPRIVISGEPEPVKSEVKIAISGVPVPPSEPPHILRIDTAGAPSGAKVATNTSSKLSDLVISYAKHKVGIAFGDVTERGAHERAIGEIREMVANVAGSATALLSAADKNIAEALKPYKARSHG